MRTLSRLSIAAMLTLSACSGSENNANNETIGTPLSCAATTDCASDQECARLDTAEGVTEKICVKEAACGTVVCASTRCGASTEGGDAACIVLEAENNASNPCANLACGATCSTCDPSDGGCPAVEEYCQADGTCGSNDQPECGTDDPCADKACGASCSTCDPSGGACPAVEEYCQADGTCGSNAAFVCEYDACAGKMCGDACTVCDPADTDCVETAEEKSCNPEGVCTGGAAAC